MLVDLSKCLVIGISSRALFDLEEENRIFEQNGVDEYRAYQREHERDMLRPGTAFPLIKAILSLNELDVEKRLVEVVILSKNSPDTGLRVFNAIEHYQLDITRAAFTGGETLSKYLEAFDVDLFLSKSEIDVQAAIDKGVAAAILYAPPEEYSPDEQEIRIAFDGDAVLFSDESEQIYREHGLKAFQEHERKNRDHNLPEGPFAKLLKTLSLIQSQYHSGTPNVRIAIVTARGSPAHARVIYTLRDWNVHVDEVFFLGGVSKDNVLKAFGAHMFFDDQDLHLASASKFVPSGKVPYKGGALGATVNKDADE